MAAGATGALLLAGGFGWFVAQIAGDEITLDRKADGIVALTGSAARIPDAIELLATEHGKRLLITGVYGPQVHAKSRASRRFIRVFYLLHRPGPLCAQHLRQRARNKTLGSPAQFQFADRRDVELAHAARHGRARPSIAGRHAHCIPRHIGKGESRALVVEP